MRTKFKWIFTLLLAFSMQFSFAQEKTVTGVVSDKLGPLPSANVVVKGTSNGVQTDFDGNYSIKAKAGDVLEVSFTGYNKKTMTIGTANSYNFVLSEGVELQEVIVVGYGTTTKESYVGTVSKIKSENIAAKTVSNVTQALKGEVAGVNVISTSGQPGTDAVIRIRGFGSVNGNRSPLYVVDGVPYSGDISAINPADIDGMTILKDATATAVYGSRGANGVILINTKTGKAGVSTISVDFKTSVNQNLLPRYNVIKSPERYIELSWEAVRNAGVLSGAANPTDYANTNLFSPASGGTGISAGYNMWNVANVSELIDPATGMVRNGVTRKYNPENWEDYAFQSSMRQEANVQFSGGNEKTRYASSFGYMDDQGFIKNSNYRRYSTRLSVTHQAKDWLKAGASIGYSGARYTTNGQSEDSGSVFWFVDNIPSIYPLFLRDAMGNKVEDPYYGGFQYDYGGAQGRGFGLETNSIADAVYNLDRSYNHDFNGNFFVNVDFTKDLTFETRYGAQMNDVDDNSRNNPFYGSSAQTYGSLYKTHDKSINQNFLQLLRYKKSFGNNNLEAFVAHESTENVRKIFSAGKQNAILYNTLDLDQYTQTVGKPGSYTRISALESYFGQVSYNYNQKYFLMASMRRDGSSRFKNDKWGTFGSVGASWLVSKESFMEKLDFVNFFKVKASYGVVGDQGNRLMNGWQLYSIGNSDDYSFTMSTEQANADLTWETSKIAQVGFEATMFDFLDVNVDYYIKNTDNLLFQQTLPTSTGNVFTYVNDGQLRNSGLEFDVNARIIKPSQPEGFRLDFGINGELLSNKLTKMPIDPGTGAPKVIDGALSEGHSIYDYYMREWAGVDPATGFGLWNTYFNDANGNGLFDTGEVFVRSMVEYMAANPDAVIGKTTTNVYTDATIKYVGKSSIPKVRGAFRLNMAYSNFDLTTQFSYSLGGYSYDNTYATLMGNGQVGGNNWHADINNRWQQPGDITDVPVLTNQVSLAGAGGNDVNRTSTRFLTKADYLGLNNVQLGYNFPTRYLDKTGLSKLSLFASGDNLLFFSARDGYNPSLSESGNSNMYRYTPLTTFSMGVKVEF